jgi:hypothetical protein
VIDLVENMGDRYLLSGGSNPVQKDWYHFLRMERWMQQQIKDEPWACLILDGGGSNDSKIMTNMTDSGGDVAPCGRKKAPDSFEKL